MKHLIRALVILSLIALVGVLVAAFSINAIAKQAVEKSGTYALGVDTTLGAAKVGILSGEFGLSELRVDNPEGFSDSPFLAVGDAKLDLALASLTQSELHVPLIELADIALEVDYEGTQSNFGVILANLERLQSGGGGSGEPTEQEGTSKTFVVDRIAIRNVVANFELPVVGEASRTTVKVPEVVVENVDSKKLTLSELMSLLVRKVLEAALAEGRGVLPDDLLKDLGGKLDALGERALGEAREKVEETLDELTDGLEGAAEELGNEVGEKLGETLEGAGDALNKGLEGLKKKGDGN